MKYPSLCLNVRASEESQFGEVLERSTISTLEIAWFHKFYIGYGFCDSDGKIWILTNLVPIRKDWSLMRLIANHFKRATIYQCKFQETDRTISLDEFKSRCKEIAQYMFVEDALEKIFVEIDSSNSYESAMDNFRIR